MLYRNCPCCHSKVTVLDVLRPCFRGKGKNKYILCGECGKVISKFFEKYIYGLALIVFFAGGLLQKIFKVETVIGFFSLFVFIVLILISVAYFFIPFDCCEDCGTE